MNQSPARDLTYVGTKLYWSFDPAQRDGITAFLLTKSTDKGHSFSALTAVAFDTTGAAYEKNTKRFFYVDAGLAAGDIFKIVVTGSDGTSQAEYLVVAPELPLCTVFGYVFDAFGNPAQVKLIASAFAPEGNGHWTINPTGTSAHDQAAVALQRAEREISVDATGLWKVALVRRAHARITCPELGIDHSFEVPNREGPVNLKDIPHLRQEAGDGLWGNESKTKAPHLMG